MGGNLLTKGTRSAIFNRMKGFKFNYCVKKNAELRNKRNIGFEDIIVALGEGFGLDVIDHPNKGKYPNQKMFVVNIDEYIHLVPFVEEDGNTLFLKTIFRSRKMTRDYIKGGN